MEEARAQNLEAEVQQAFAEMSKLTQSIEQYSRYVAQIPVGGASAAELQKMEDEHKALQVDMYALNSQYTDMLSLQTLKEEYDETFSLLTDIIKAQHQINESIIRNII